MSARWGRTSPAVREALRLGRQYRREQTRSADPCRCEHPYRLHLHVVPGMRHCLACAPGGCRAFRDARPARARALAALRRAVTR